MDSTDRYLIGVLPAHLPLRIREALKAEERRAPGVGGVTARA